MKLDIRQTIMKSCAFDGEGYCIKRGGWNMSVSRHKQNLADITRERERWSPRLREFKKGSVIKREGRLDVH